MKHYKKLSILALMMTLLSFQSFAQKAETSPPELIAVKFHADWCGSCKAMGPAFSDLRNKLDGESVLFVELDFTNNTSKHQAMLLASALGIDEVVAQNKATGFILLLDRESKEVRDRFLKDKTVKEMAKSIQTLL